MRGVIPRRWVRQAGEALGQARDLPAATRLRREIALLMAQAPARRDPLYRAELAAAVRGTKRAAPLREALRTLLAFGAEPPEPEPDGGPLVSVVMPVRDRAAVVGTAVGSVLAQTHASLELIVCDDASRDATASVLRGFADPRLQLISLAEHGGAAAARNRCLDQAAGTLIAYCDSDNLWHPRFLELVVAEWRREPNAAAVFAGYFDCALASNGSAAIRRAVVRPYDREAQIAAPFIDLNSFVHRRALVDIYGGFDESLVRRQDYDLIVRYCWDEAPLRLPYALNLYRRAAHLGQITQRHGGDPTAPAIIAAKIEAYRRDGGPPRII